MSGPSDAGFRQPAEWTPHRACWLAFPSDPDLWPALVETQAAFARLSRAIAAPGPNIDGEQLEILVRDSAARSQAQGLLAGLPARFHEFAFGDIWMRDIAPIFLRGADGSRASVRFRFNGWGGKYDYPGDSQVAEHVQQLTSFARFASELVLEGGAVECDGAGLCLTTREVALNPNRNPGLSQADVERELCAALGATRVLWLDRGLRNDHTDGHIDNIARFIGPGRVLCMRAQTADDPNAQLLPEIEHTLRAYGLQVDTIPSPGLVLGREGDPLPASYLNFYIANGSVVVPVFGSTQDEAALAALAPFFPERRVEPVPAKLLLQEGGTVHCISQQEPSL